MSTWKQERQKRLIEVLAKDNDIIQGDDGYYVYWPIKNKGCLDAWELRLIADYIDELNEPWDKQMREYFEREELDDVV